MKYVIIIAVISIGISASLVFQPKLKECPDAISGNMMPGAGERAYYLKNGEVRKISAYNVKWVSANCKIEDERVW